MRSGNALDRLQGAIKHGLQLIPAKARLPVISGSLLVIALLIYTSFFTGSATLKLVCRHSFQTGRISVSIDGAASYSGLISGSPRRLLGLFGSGFEGTFSKVLTVPAGKHAVEVRLVSAAEGFDETGRCDLNLPSGKESTLMITTRHGEVSLVSEGASLETTSASSGYFASVRALLVTVIGSAVSAIIGFFVQDFLRSRKTA